MIIDSTFIDDKAGDQRTSNKRDMFGICMNDGIRNNSRRIVHENKNSNFIISLCNYPSISFYCYIFNKNVSRMINQKC